MCRSLFLVAATLALVACHQPNSGSKPVPQTLSLDGGAGSSLWGFSPLTDLTSTRKVTFTRPAGHVSYVLTNTSTVASAKLSGVSGSVAESRSVVSRSVTSVNKNAHRIISLADRPSAPDRPQQTRTRSVAPAPSFDTTPSPGDTYNFIDALWTSSPQAANVHPSHLRTQIVSDGHKLNVWVADDCWAGDSTNPALPEPDSASGANATATTTSWVPPTNKVTQAMVDELAYKFLADGTHGSVIDQDIYHWDTTVFGVEWPSIGAPTYYYSGHHYTMVDSEGNIHIFVCNLNSSGDTSDGILLGYFHALNNFLAADQTGSNEKILFALDADSLANPSNNGDDTDTSWAITDYWPAQALSTLAHEFQHMIHFYQKQVSQNISTETDTWINEMCSMLTEDLVSDKLGTPGPRGVVGTIADPDYTTGAANNENGRLPDFNYWHDLIPLTGWNSAQGVLANYANAYAFGAWLVRNYGGPALLRDIVQNQYTDYQAVVHAVNAQTNGGAATFASLVRDWGLATALNSSTQPGLAYSSGSPPGGAFSWSLTPETYQAGSIDLGKYKYAWNASAGQPAGSLVGVWNDGTSFAAGDVVAAGATSIHTGTFVGSAKVTLTLPPNVVLTVVAQ